jgi:hypothetical protein
MIRPRIQRPYDCLCLERIKIATGQIVLIDHDGQSSLIHESEDDEREAAEGLTQVY